jgi:hypothetical protein
MRGRPSVVCLKANGYKKEGRTGEGTTQGSGWRGDPTKGRESDWIGAWDNGGKDRHRTSCDAAEEEDRKAGEEEQGAIASQGEEKGEEEGGKIGRLAGNANQPCNRPPVSGPPLC